MRRRRWTLITALVLVAMARQGTAATAPQSVRPGAIVRWPGEGIVECRQGDQRSTPLEGVCYFPIDLLATGKLAVERRTAQGVERRTLAIASYPYPTESLTGVEEKYVSPPKAELARIEREQQETAAVFRRRTARSLVLPLGKPLAKLPEGGRFGSRRIFNGEARSPHGGTDFKAAAGTVVYAAADGVVALAASQFFAGNAVYVDHGDGLVTMSFHLSAMLVKTGAIVQRGQAIGKV
ncbi:MAG: M23 family metallopeptidase, partial [Thermoanaerobaculia bacterium]